MYNLIVGCPHCNQNFKVVRKEDKFIFITDLGGKFVPDENYMYTCLKCNNKFDISKNCMKTDAWIADLVFTIKGN